MIIEELTKIHKVLGAGLVTNEGVVLESHITSDYNPDKLGALAARIVNRAKQSLGLAKTSVILYTLNLVFFAKETEKGIFFVMCRKDANIGLVMLKIDKIK